MGTAHELQVLVTVGMGRWPFDRLLRAVEPLCAEHRVFAQTGTSDVELPCPHAPFVSSHELNARIAVADVVITHAGNTVRLVQRAGKVPIAVARESARGEMGNDHQATYLRAEERDGRVVAVWDVRELPAVVARHPETTRRLIGTRSLPPAADRTAVADQLDRIAAELTANARRPRRVTPGWDAPAVADDVRDTSRYARRGSVPVPTSRRQNPFARHPLRRYAFAWDHVAFLDGTHLDIGTGFGDFAGPLARSTNRPVIAVDAHNGYVAEARRRFPEMVVNHVPAGSPLGLSDGSVTSVTLLDVLEHAADERQLLREARRVLAPGGTVVVSVPRRHVFSWLDPDNAKYRWPRLHRRVYSARFGAEAYHDRFVDLSDGFRGDIAASRKGHTNYRTCELLAMLRAAGFEPVLVAGANLFWRWLQIPCLLGGPRARGVLGAAIRVDGLVFRSPRLCANLFVVGRRLP